VLPTNLKSMELFDESDKIPIVFIPGWLASAKATWNNFAHALHKQKRVGNRKMYLLDMPGIGVNKNIVFLKGEQFSIKALAMSVLKFIYKQKFEKVILFGHGLGAIIAMHANEMQHEDKALRENPPIKGIVAIDPVPAFDTKLQQVAKGLAQAICKATLGKPKKTVDASAAGRLIKMVTNNFPNFVYLKEESLEIDMTEEAKKIPLNVACGSLDMINTYLNDQVVMDLTKVMPDSSAIVFGRGQTKFGRFHFQVSMQPYQQVIKASFDHKETFIHFPSTYDWNTKKGVKGEQQTVTAIIVEYLKQYFDGEDTESPTQSPTGPPTMSPTNNPTGPSDPPAPPPTKHPTGPPTLSPTASPTRVPTGPPTDAPTGGPRPSVPSGPLDLGDGNVTVTTVESKTTYTTRHFRNGAPVGESTTVVTQDKPTQFTTKTIHKSSDKPLPETTQAVPETTQDTASSSKQVENEKQEKPVQYTTQHTKGALPPLRVRAHEENKKHGGKHSGTTHKGNKPPQRKLARTEKFDEPDGVDDRNDPMEPQY